MNAAEIILAPTQRNAIALIQDFVCSGKPSANLLAPRGCGSTTLFESLVQYRGFGDQPIEFIHRSVRTTRAPSSSLSSKPECLGHRVVFLLDRAASNDSVCDLASQSNEIQWIKANSPSRFGASSRASIELHLPPLSQDQIRRFVDSQRFTAAGRLIRFADETIRKFSARSGGRLRDLIPLIHIHVKNASIADKQTVAPVPVQARTVQARTVQASAPDRRAA